MDLPGDSTWSVHVSGGDTFALYVRDALGVSSPTADAIPPLDPLVPRANLPVPEGFADSWDTWWIHVLGGGRTSGGSEHVRERWPAGLPAQLVDAQ